MEYKHFSHQHNMNLHQVQAGQEFLCSGCETKCLESNVYACWHCNFFLHEHCGNANRFIKHPSHPHHPLILLPSPTYCSGAFLCNACGVAGNAFSYCCALCEVDLHLQCAFLPPTVNHKSHPHELSLTNSTTPQKDSFPYNCKLCNNLLQSKHWNYQCPKCDFQVHTFCATKEVKPGLYLDDEHSDLGPTEAQPDPRLGGFGTRDDEPVLVELSEEAVVELFKAQLQMQMAEQIVEMLASSNLSVP